mgnify:FL=1
MKKSDYVTPVLSVTNASNGLKKLDKNNLPDSLKYMTMADDLRNSGEYKKAVSCYLQSIMLERTNTESYLGLGISYKYLNNYEKAIENFQKSLEVNTSDIKTQATSYYEMGICYLLENELTKAIICFQKSIMIDKTNLDVQLQLALAHELAQEDDMAMKIYDKLIEEHPEYAKAHSHKAALLICEGRYADAIKIFMNVLKIEPNFYRAYFGLGVCFDNLKNFLYARKYYKKFLKVHPNSTHAEYVQNRLSALKEKVDTAGHLRLV